MYPSGTRSGRDGTCNDLLIPPIVTAAVLFGGPDPDPDPDDDDEAYLRDGLAMLRCCGRGRGEVRWGWEGAL